MKIDGKQIAQHILDNLGVRVADLKRKGIVPHLVIILVGDDPASYAYTQQKKLKGKEIGVEVEIYHLDLSVKTEEVIGRVKTFNSNSKIHGVIIQRPLPSHIDAATIDSAVDPTKDVDGFHPQTKFQMPLAKAVLKILESVFIRRSLASQGDALQRSFRGWLAEKSIVVIGKGKTGGAPVISALHKLGVQPLIIDSKTENPELKTKKADILISTVGKPNILKTDMLKMGVILIGVGMFKEEDGKLHGDYEEEQIKDVATFYTPTPGGVGPVNVAMLLANVVKAAEHVAG